MDTEVGNTCQETRTNELPNSMNKPHTRTVLPPYITGKKITRPDTSIPGKQWNMPIRLSRRRKKLFGSPRTQRRSNKGAWPRRSKFSATSKESPAISTPPEAPNARFIEL
jgi:hypothetical protein